MMKKLFLITLICLGYYSLTHANNINITTKPNPAIPGQKLRFTLESGNIPINKATVVLTTGEKVQMRKIDSGLYAANYTVPKTAKGGAKQAKLYIKTTGDRVVMLKVRYEVSKFNPNNTAQAGLDLNESNIQPLDEANLNLKIDELEANLDRMQRDKQSLQNRIKNLQKELEDLRRNKKSDDELKKKEEELKKLQEELRKQLEDFERQKDELAKNQEKLKRREQEVKRRNEELTKEQRRLESEKIDLEALRRKLQENNESISQKQQDVTKKEQKIEQQRDEISKQQSELAQKEQSLKDVERQVNERTDTLKALSQELQSEKDDIKNREQNLQEQENMLQFMKNNIQSRDQNLMQMSEQLQVEKDQLQSQMKRLNEELANLDSKEDELASIETDLTTRSNELSEKLSELDSKTSQLESQEQALNERESTLSGKESELSERETSLLEIEQSLDTQSKELSASKEQLASRREELLAQQAMLAAASQGISSKQSSILSQQAALSEERSDIRELSETLTAQKLAFETERTQVQKEISAKEAQLEQQSLMQNQRENELADRSKDLKERLENILDRENKLEAQNEAVQADIDNKYTELQKLKDWIDVKTQTLLENEKAAKADRKNRLDLEQELARLESLTRLYKKRTDQMKTLNGQLKVKNHELENEIVNVIQPDYRYAITPYVGYRIFEANRSLASGPEVGIKVMEYLKQNFYVEGSLGMVSTFQNRKENAKTEYLATYAANVLWDLDKVETWGNFFFSLGIGGDFSTGRSMGITFGAGYKFDLSNDLSNRFDVKMDQDIAASIGFEKKVSVIQKKRYVARLTATEGVDLGGNEAPETVELLLNVPKTKDQYVFRQIRFSDAIGHWAEKAINHITKLGLIEPPKNKNEKPVFRIKDTVSKIEATKLLVLAAHIKSILHETDANITYTIIDIPGYSYFSTVHIKNRRGKIIKTLIRNRKEQAGEYAIVWDGTDKYNEKVPGGDYTVEFLASVKDKKDDSKYKVVASKSSKIKVVALHRPKFESVSADQSFKDVSQKYWGRQYINEAYKLDLFKRQAYSQAFPKNRNYFQPNAKIKRIEFMLAISQILEYMGAQSYALADLSPYKDTASLPMRIKKPLALYISSLGYGGDDRRRLRPNDYITRAEAAVILNRFLNWEKKG